MEDKAQLQPTVSNWGKWALPEKKTRPLWFWGKRIQKAFSLLGHQFLLAQRTFSSNCPLTSERSHISLTSSATLTQHPKLRLTPNLLPPSLAISSVWKNPAQSYLFWPEGHKWRGISWPSNYLDNSCIWGEGSRDHQSAGLSYFFVSGP
jgi:hypothetical protein